MFVFFLFFFGGHMSFFGATGTPVLDFWWRLLWGKHNVHSLRSTSGATLADLLVAGVQPVLSPHTVAEVRLPGFELVLSEYLWARRSTNWAKPGPTCVCLNHRLPALWDLPFYWMRSSKVNSSFVCQTLAQYSNSRCSAERHEVSRCRLQRWIARNISYLLLYQSTVKSFF